MDRSQEQLGTTDTAIIRSRRVLLNAARHLDQDPPGLQPASQRVRSVSIVLPKDVPWAEGAGEALVASPDSYLVSA